MHSTRFQRRTLAMAVLLGGAQLLFFSLPLSAAESSLRAADSGSLLLAQAPEESSDGKLEPRYQPREPEPKSKHNSSYIFGMTRGVADSTIHPAVKAPLFLVTLPLDLVLLPFAAIGGMFG